LGVLTETCTLDVADRGGTTEGELAELLGITRQRVNQLVTRALEALEEPMAEHHDDYIPVPVPAKSETRMRVVPKPLAKAGAK
jgi:hypothetical protein